MIRNGQDCSCPSEASLRKAGVDEKDGANAEPAGEAASRGRGNFRVATRKLSVFESLRLRRSLKRSFKERFEEVEYVLFDSFQTGHETCTASVRSESLRLRTSVRSESLHPL